MYIGHVHMQLCAIKRLHVISSTSVYIYIQTCIRYAASIYFRKAYLTALRQFLALLLPVYFFTSNFRNGTSINRGKIETCGFWNCSSDALKATTAYSVFIGRRLLFLKNAGHLKYVGLMMRVVRISFLGIIINAFYEYVLQRRFVYIIVLLLPF